MASFALLAPLTLSPVPSSSCTTPTNIRFSSIAHMRMSTTATGGAPNLRLFRRSSRLSAKSASTDLDEKVVQSVKDAEELCAADTTSGECVAAWDEVEELSAARYHKKVAEQESKDPLDAYCKENPETDECRVYED